MYFVSDCINKFAIEMTTEGEVHRFAEIAREEGLNFSDTDEEGTLVHINSCGYVYVRPTKDLNRVAFRRGNERGYYKKYGVKGITLADLLPTSSISLSEILTTENLTT